MKRLFIVLVVLVILNPAFAGDIAAGEAKAVICMTCHGEAGISSNDLWPNLAGQKEGYLNKQIRAFRDDHPLIARFMATLSDVEAENLAAYFSTLE